MNGALLGLGVGLLLAEVGRLYEDDSRSKKSSESSTYHDEKVRHDVQEIKQSTKETSTTVKEIKKQINEDFVPTIRNIDKELDNMSGTLDIVARHTISLDLPNTLKRKNAVECLEAAVILGDADGELGKIILKDGNPFYCYQYLKRLSPENKNEFVEKVAKSNDANLCLMCAKDAKDIDRKPLIEVIAKSGNTDAIFDYLKEFPEDTLAVQDEVIDSKNVEAIKQLTLNFNAVDKDASFEAYKEITGDKSFSSSDEWYGYLYCENYKGGYYSIYGDVTSKATLEEITNNPDYMLGIVKYLVNNGKIYDRVSFSVIDVVKAFEKLEVPQKTKDTCAKMFQEAVNKIEFKYTAVYDALKECKWFDYKSYQDALLKDCKDPETILAFAQSFKDEKDININALADAIVKTAKADNMPTLIEFAKEFNDKIDIKPLQEAVIKVEDADGIYRFAQDIKGADIKSLQEALIKTKSLSYMYGFARDVKGADIKTLQDEILKSREDRYIISFAQDVKGADLKEIEDYYVARLLSDNPWVPIGGMWGFDLTDFAKLDGVNTARLANALAMSKDEDVDEKCYEFLKHLEKPDAETINALASRATSYIIDRVHGRHPYNYQEEYDYYHRNSDKDAYWKKDKKRRRELFLDEQKELYTAKRKDIEELLDKVTDISVKTEILDKLSTYMENIKRNVFSRAAVGIKKALYTTKKKLSGLLTRDKQSENETEQENKSSTLE